MPKESGHATLDEVAQWACMKSIELKACCKERKLPVTGTMSQLIARLYTGRKQPKDIEDDLMKELGHKNEYLVKRFTEAAQQEEGFRQLAFQSIAKMMTFYPYEIKDSKQLKGIRGIGKGTCKRIDDYLAEQAEEREPNVDERDEECKVWPAPMGHDPEYNPESIAMQVLHAVVVCCRFWFHIILGQK